MGMGLEGLQEAAVVREWRLRDGNRGWYDE
jgi:hypothetical protein